LPNRGFSSSSAVLLGRYIEEVAPEIRPATLEQYVPDEIGRVKPGGNLQ
jgi:hypothetical protein